MTEFEVIRGDAIRLAVLVLNLSEKHKPYRARAQALGHGALGARNYGDLEHVCQELRTICAKLLEIERSGRDRGRDMDDPDLEPSLNDLSPSPGRNRTQA